MLNFIFGAVIGCILTVAVEAALVYILIIKGKS